MRILHNTRCCIGGAVFHWESLQDILRGFSGHCKRSLMGRRNSVRIPESEHPLLDSALKVQVLAAVSERRLDGYGIMTKCWKEAFPVCSAWGLRALQGRSVSTFLL